MAWLFTGIVLAALLLFLLSWWANADVKTARGSLFWAIVGLCGLFGVIMFAAGKGFLAIFPAAYAAWRMFGARAAATVGGQSRGGSNPASRQPSLTREEALDVLGLDKGASDADIRAAHRRLIAQCHPDKGGSDWMAAKLNEARRTLLGE